MSAFQTALSFIGIYPEESGAAETKISNQTRFTPVSSISSKRRKKDDIEIISTHNPKVYKDCLEIAEDFRQDIPVIINLQFMKEAEARRMLDFCIGLVEGLSGNIKRVTKTVFLLAPHYVDITSGEEGFNETESLLG